MSKSRAYSTRLKFEDEVDVKAMDTLDNLVEPENTLQWIREAIRRRLLEEEAKPAIETAPLARAELGQLVEDHLEEEDPLHLQILTLLKGMSEEEKSKWILESIQMRYALEKHAPAFFIHKYYENQLHEHETIHRASVIFKEESSNNDEQIIPAIDVVDLPPAAKIIPAYLLKCLEAKTLFEQIDHIVEE